MRPSTCFVLSISQSGKSFFSVSSYQAVGNYQQEQVLSQWQSEKSRRKVTSAYFSHRGLNLGVRGSPAQELVLYALGMLRSGFVSASENMLRGWPLSALRCVCPGSSPDCRMALGSPVIFVISTVHRTGRTTPEGQVCPLSCAKLNPSGRKTPPVL